jgi:hypothetical protein
MASRMANTDPVCLNTSSTSVIMYSKLLLRSATERDEVSAQLLKATFVIRDLDLV